MPLLDHLGELRRRLTIIVICVLIAAIVFYAATPIVIEFLLDPIRQFLPEGGRLSVLSALGGFTIRFKVAMYIGVIVTSPIIIWEVMAFLLPALKPNERKWVVPTVIALVILFFLGMVFCYLVIQRAAFGWLLSQTVEFATIVANAEDFISTILLLEVGFGIAFELPLVIFYLAIFHIVPYRVMRENWRFVYVGLLTLSAVVTPDASPITMVLMFAALIALYEVALAVARMVITAREGKDALKRSKADYEELYLED